MKNRFKYSKPSAIDLSGTKAVGGQINPMGVCEPSGFSPAVACSPTGQLFGAPNICTGGGYVVFGCNHGSIPTL